MSKKNKALLMAQYGGTEHVANFIKGMQRKNAKLDNYTSHGGYEAKREQFGHILNNTATTSEHVGKILRIAPENTKILQFVMYRRNDVPHDELKQIIHQHGTHVPRSTLNQNNLTSEMVRHLLNHFDTKYGKTEGVEARDRLQQVHDKLKAEGK